MVTWPKSGCWHSLPLTSGMLWSTTRFDGITLLADIASCFLSFCERVAKHVVDNVQYSGRNAQHDAQDTRSRNQAHRPKSYLRVLFAP